MNKPAVYLKSSKQGSIRRGHPWIFPKAIARQVHFPKTGTLIDIHTEEGALFGKGIYNEHSLYRVRIVALISEALDTSSLETIIAHRLQQANLIRLSLNLPNSLTNAYRLLNSEGDGLSGLTIDRFNHICAVSSSAYWVEANKPLIIKAIQNLLPDDEIIWLPQDKALKQDGWNTPIKEPKARNEKVLEGGVFYEVDFANAQKTGLFLDQRDNHMRIASLASGKRVLDLYTYTGGFALHAAKAGAIQVTAVDSSSSAILSARKNAELNQVSTIEWIEGDSRDYLALSEHHDIIIVDPPKLAPSQQHLQRAKNYYRFLHREIFKVMKTGSLLMTCNCSSALSASEFTELVFAQAAAVGRTARVLGVFGPSLCHPTLPAFPEGHYLTALLIGLV